jgi:hypothetical protein
MALIKLQGNASGTGSMTLTSPNTNSDLALGLPASSGTLIATGDTGTVSTTMLAAAAVTSAKVETLMQPLGVGQTWQDVSASRVSGTTYTNTTGRPIMVSIRSDTSSSGVLTVGGVQISWADTNTTNRSVVVGVVPAGATYVYTGGYLSGFWAELR